MDQTLARPLELLSFHEELQALLQCVDEEAAKQLLFRSLERRDAAGVLFVGTARPPGEPLRFRPIWAETIYRLPDGMSIRDIAAPIGREMPRLLRAWLARRRTPVSLSGITRFIPYSSNLILRLGSPAGVPTLRDVVWVPYNHRGRQYCMIVGVFRRADGEFLAEIVSLAMAYTVKWIGGAPVSSADAGDAPSPAFALKDRELECLRWLVAGKTLQDVADITGMSYANVRYHVENAKRRHGYATTQQLMVQAALDYGLSPMGPDAPPYLPPAGFPSDRPGSAPAAHR